MTDEGTTSHTAEARRAVAACLLLAPAAVLLYRLCRLRDRSQLRRCVLFNGPERLSTRPATHWINRQHMLSGAVDQNINGTTYFIFGSAYYRPFYSGSSVIYQVVAKPA